ncbi:hypothetical protein ATCC90586_009704 [Pythium insidiosum]|nr:hypothetical protein ATCC90586_009704 [Pythium insidiosum]
MEQALVSPISSAPVADGSPFYVELQEGNDDPADAAHKPKRRLPELGRASVLSFAPTVSTSVERSSQATSDPPSPAAVSRELCRWSGRLIVALYIFSSVVWPSVYVPALGIATGIVGEYATRDGYSKLTNVNSVLAFVAMNGAMIGVLLFVLVFDFAVRLRQDDSGPRSLPPANDIADVDQLDRDHEEEGR